MPVEPDKHLEAIHLGVVCPMANEIDTARRFVAAALEHCAAAGRVTFFVVLDRVSRDGTRELMDLLAREDSRIKVVWAPRNQCVVDAYIAGYSAALEAGCDWILEIDAGFSHQPEDIPKFLTKMSEGYDCVFGSRFCVGGGFEDSSKKRYLISLGGTFLANRLLGTRLTDMTSGFELFRAEALQDLKDLIRSRGPFFQTEIKAHSQRYRVTELPIVYRAASHHITQASIRDALVNLGRLFRLRLIGKL